MKELQIFQNNQFGEVRVTTTETGEPMFCLADVCKILDLQTNKVKERLKQEGWNTIPTLTNGGMQNMTFVNEPNFYKAVFQSRKPEAEAFTEWVTSEVLPAIRKHGAYMTAQTIEKALTDPDTLIQLATNLKEERRQRLIIQERAEMQSRVIQEAAPKVKYYDDVLQARNLFPTTIIAKELGLSAQGLNLRLNQRRIIYKMGETWVLYHKYQNLGLTGTKTTTYTDSSGETKTAVHTYWTQKGRAFIHDLIKRKVTA